MAVFFLITLSINFEISASSNMETLAKVEFEINVLHTYLKKLSTRNAVGGGGDVTKKSAISNLLEYLYSVEPKLFLPLNSDIFKDSYGKL